MPHAKASCLVSQIRYSTVSWTNAVYRKPTYSLNTITLWCIIFFSYHRRSLFCWKAQISKRSPGFHRVPERTLSRASICSDRTKTRTDHFHYGQFGNADHLTTRVFGLVEETGLPGGNPRSTERRCKLCAHKAEVGFPPNAGAVRQMC